MFFGRFLPKSAKMLYGPLCMISMRAACMYGASGNCGAACIGFKFRHFRQARQRHCGQFPQLTLTYRVLTEKLTEFWRAKFRLKTNCAQAHL